MRTITMLTCLGLTLLLASCSDDTAKADSSTTTDATSQDAPAGKKDSAQSEAAPSDTSAKPDTVVTADSAAKPDSNCLKPGAKPGPKCKSTNDCHLAKLQYCFLKCMGCGCTCYAGRCYDLRQFTCK